MGFYLGLVINERCVPSGFLAQIQRKVIARDLFALPNRKMIAFEDFDHRGVGMGYIGIEPRDPVHFGRFNQMRAAG